MLKLQLHEDDLNTANLYLSSERLPKPNALSPTVVDITTRFQPERKRVENFIKRIYKEEYNADIVISFPVLMSIRNAQGDILAALGFRYAAEDPLFLEQYTEKPIDKILGAPRSAIAEVGNLASAGGGASLFLFTAITSYLEAKNITHITVTGTDCLHRHFRQLGLQPQKICDADIAAVNNDEQNWGTYYDTQPRVLSGSIPHCVRCLKQTLGAEYKKCRPRLFPRLHYRSERCKNER